MRRVFAARLLLAASPGRAGAYFVQLTAPGARIVRRVAYLP
jgi:hypothetical protein